MQASELGVLFLPQRNQLFQDYAYPWARWDDAMECPMDGAGDERTFGIPARLACYKDPADEEGE
jgi:hypothetical protein